MKRLTWQVTVLALGVAFLGAGCWSNTIPGEAQIPVVKAPQRADFTGLTPEEVAKKVQLTQSVVLQLDRNFTGRGADQMAKKGYGASAMQTMVIKRFAPGNVAEVDWTSTSDFRAMGGKTEKRTYIGSMVAIDLQKTRELLPPTYWPEGAGNARGTSGIWLSAEAFENIAKGGGSTLYLGIPNPELAKMGQMTTDTQLMVQAFAKELRDWKGNGDPFYFERVPGVTSTSLRVNGAAVTVATIQAKSRFGQITILNNAQNPIILSFVGSPELETRKLGGLFDWSIVEIKDVME